MRTRHLAALALPLLLLSACAPAVPDVDDPTPAPVPEQTDVVDGVALDLPPDGLMGIRTTVTAGSGASIDVTLVVHEALAATDPASADAVAATEAWCSGEMDGTILASQGYSMLIVSVTALSNGGDWPAGASLHVYPEPRPNIVLTATGDLRQTPAGAEGDATPHCVTPVSLDGPGNGTIIVGIAGDVDGDGDGTAPLGGFIHQMFGFNATSPDGTVADVTFSDCVVKVSALGSSYGALSGPDWTSPPGAGACAAGGGMG